MKDLSTFELLALVQVLCGKFFSDDLVVSESKYEIKDEGTSVQYLRLLNRVSEELVSRIQLPF